MGSRQNPSIQTWSVGHVELIIHIVLGWQNPNWQTSPAMQSDVVAHAGGGTL